MMFILNPVYFSKPRFSSPAIRCPVIYADDNVLVQGDTDNAKYRHLLRFSCRSNHQVLSGPQEIYCDERGEWTGTVPKCIGTESLLHTLTLYPLGIYSMCKPLFKIFVFWFKEIEHGIVTLHLCTSGSCCV